jgi:tRNA dimethylallyltransferase
MKGIGYKEIMDYYDGKYTLEEAIDTIKKNTRHYAKKQLTWFRRYDRIKWYNISEYVDDEDAVEDISQWLIKRT